jgi:hypothetical protein
MKPRLLIGSFVVGVASVLGCSSGGDPVAGFIAEVDLAPAEKRPPNWERTKALMARPVPAVGAAAPDFTLKTVDGATAITRSKFHPDRPLVLVFGSFT